MTRLIALVVALFVALPAAAQDTPLVRFGAIADPQYAPAAPRGTRFYANSLWKLSVAIGGIEQGRPRFRYHFGRHHRPPCGRLQPYPAALPEGRNR